MFYEDIFKQLNKRRIDYVVVGGVALVLHGVVRLTADLDLMLHLDEKNLNNFVALMNETGYKPKLPVKAESLIDSEKRKSWFEERNMKVFSFYHPRQAISLIDVFIHEPLSYKVIKRHSVKMKIGNLLIPVISVDDLVKLKNISGRPQDMEDIKALRRLKRNRK